MGGGRVFQRRGAEQLKALAPMVLSLNVGTVKIAAEEEQSDREGVYGSSRSERYWGARWCRALKVSSKIL